MKNTVPVTYTLKSADVDLLIDLRFDQKDFSLLDPPTSDNDWTWLSCNKCSHCPLSEEQFPQCPLANAIDVVISKLHAVLSHERIQATATFRNRTVCASVSVQEAVSSLLGLIIPASGCPHLVYFRPLCRFHQPFATVEETIFRSTSMFLLAQYFLNRKNGSIPANLNRLETIYGNVHTVNHYICRRLRQASRNDCSVNAMVILDMFTLAIQSAIKHNLKQLAPYFSIYNEAPALSVAKSE